MATTATTILSIRQKVVWRIGIVNYLKMVRLINPKIVKQEKV